MESVLSESDCARCGRALERSLLFVLRSPSGDLAKCLRCALFHPPVVRRSLIASAVVGTILTGLNQGDHLFSGAWPATLSWKVPLTYLVPFLVSMWGALGSARR